MRSLRLCASYRQIFRCSIVLLLLLFLENPVLADGNLQGHLINLLPHNAQWALVVVDLKENKQVVASGNALKEPLAPGSLVKLFVTGAMLAYGTPNLETTIANDGTSAEGILNGNLYLIGRGNPFLSTADLKHAAERLAQQGIHKITGSIIADDTLFDTKGLERTRKGPGYAPAGAVGLDLHTVALTVTPTEPGKPPVVSVDPPNDGVRLAVAALTTTTTASTLQVTQIDDTSYRVTGNKPAGSGPLKWRFALADPALYSAGTLRACLRLAHVEVKGEIKKGKAPIDANLLAEIPGPRLDTLIRDMNVNSLNVVADNLLLLIGAEKYGAPGTRETGIKAVYAFMGEMRLKIEDVKLADGSGLSTENRMTAHFIAEYLARVTKKPWFKDFQDSLPRAGMEGTAGGLGYRNEKFRVKTGVLEDVFALAGYGVNAKGHEIAFAYIVNVPGAAAMGLERSGADVMRYLAEH